MTSGMACFIRFSSVDAESRFKQWVIRGNARSGAMGLTSLGLNARVRYLGDNEYLFLWEHLFFFNLSWFLRFMLWFQFRKVRKFVTFRRASKLDLAEIILRGGSFE